MKTNLQLKLVLGTNIAIAAWQIFYLAIRTKYLPPLVPLWYTRPWGEAQLATPAWLWLLPISSILLILINFFLIRRLTKKNAALEANAFLVLTTLGNLILAASLYRIIQIAALPFPPLINLTLGPLILPFLLSLALAGLITPKAIQLAKKLNIVDDPRTHRHPAILHKIPIPRGGIVPVWLTVLVISLLFLPLSKQLGGVLIAALIMTLVGVLDDKYDLNPYLRFGLNFLAAAVVVGAGIGIRYFTSPFGGILRVDLISVPVSIFGTRYLSLPADIIALLWIVWVANMLSWSNGVDGQFAGITGTTCLVIALLSLRLVDQDPAQWPTAKLAAITGGAIFGVLPYTWHPAKVFWGYGATAVGLIIATLSILSGTKIFTALLVMMVPLIDAFYTIYRRVKNGKSPFWGDRQHLHHKLLDLGWSHQKVALFYWGTTLLLGIVGLLSSGRATFLAILMAGGIVGFLIVLANLKGRANKTPSPAVE